MTSTSGFTNTPSNLLANIRSFLIGGGLGGLPVGQQWVQLRYVAGDELVMKGLGSGGTDEIIVGMKLYQDSATGIYSIIFNSFTAWNSGLTFYQQAGAMQQSQNLICMPVNSNPSNINEIKYWLIGNARHFKVIARVGSVYHQAYAGFIIPYGTPSEWPYPVCIGGSGLINLSGVSDRFSSTSNSISAFWKPQNAFSVGSYNETSTLFIRDGGGNQIRLWNRVSNSITNPSAGTWPYIEQLKETAGDFTKIRLDTANGYSLFPIIICNDSPANLYGEFDGIRFITGYNNSTEDIVTISGVNWLIMQNVFRTGDGEFCAYQLN